MPDQPLIVESSPEDEDHWHYIALAMLLEKRGGWFSFTEAEYFAFRDRQLGMAQVIITFDRPSGSMRLELMRDNRRAN